MNLLKEAKARWLKLTEPPIRLSKPWAKIPTERLGTGYGGWIIPAGFLTEKSVCYLVGAGTDVSFDVALSRKYGCEIRVIDPTPRAAAHFEELKSRTLSGEKMPLAASPTGFYDAEKGDFEKMQFQKVGLWSESKTVRFYSPPDPSHVSHSIVNLHRTESFFDAPVVRLSELMRQNGHTRLDLLKIDIEGAELEVIKTIVEDRLDIGAICVEFDENHRHHIDRNYVSRIEAALNALESIGFRVFAKEPGMNNFSLVNS